MGGGSVDIGAIIRGISIYGVPILLAIILHEIAHGWVAEKFGDNTARRAGRITLNPISHIDIIGTVILPLMLIVMRSPFVLGWAKPVPVNFAALRNPKKDMVWVALSGPATNFVLALASAFAFRAVLIVEPSAWKYALYASPEMLRELGVGVALVAPLVLMLGASILINCVLMVLNLIPVPPLDGGRVMVGLLPESAAYKYAQLERFGILIVLGLIFLVPPARQLFWLFVLIFVKIFSLIAGADIVSILVK